MRAPELHVDALATGATSRVSVDLLPDDADRAFRLTAIVVRGEHPGPILGVAGGMRCNDEISPHSIEHWAERLCVSDLHGTVVAIPNANVLGRDVEQPCDAETADLAEVYMHRLLARVVGQLDVLVELRAPVAPIEQVAHVRLLLHDATAARLARLQHPIAMVDLSAASCTLLGSAQRLGITAISVAIASGEASNAASCDAGLYNALCHLRMRPALESLPEVAPAYCDTPQWITVDAEVGVESIRELGTRVARGEPLARLRRRGTAEALVAPYDCIVLARRASPPAAGPARLVEIAPVRSDARRRGAKGSARRDSDLRNDQNGVYRSCRS